jgi:hypothetical protein
MKVAFTETVSPEQLADMRRYYRVLYGTAPPRSSRALVRDFIASAIESRWLALADDLSNNEETE